MQVEAFVLLEFLDDPIDDLLVEVIAAEVRIAIGGFHFDDAFTDFEDGNVEGAAAEVVNSDGFIFLFVQTVGECGSGRLVDDALDVESRDFAGLLGGLALRIVEISRDGDNGVLYFFSEKIFRGVF